MDFFAIPLVARGRIFGFLTDADLLTLKKVSTDMEKAVSLFFEPGLVEGVVHPTPSVKVECFRRYGHPRRHQGYEMSLSSKDNGESRRPKSSTKVSSAMKRVLEFIIDLDYRMRTSRPKLNIQEVTSPLKKGQGDGIVCPLIWSSRCGKAMLAANRGHPSSTGMGIGREKPCLPETTIRINGERLLTQIHGHLLYLDLQTDRVSWIEEREESRKRFGIVVKNENVFSFCLRHIDLSAREGNYLELYEEDIPTRERKWTGVRVNIFTNWDAPQCATHQPLIRGVEIETPAAKGADALRIMDFEMEDIRGMWLDQVEDGLEVLFILVQRLFGQKFSVYTMSVTSSNPQLCSFLNLTTDAQNNFLDRKPEPSVLWKYCEKEGKMKCIIPNFERDFGQASRRNLSDLEPFERWTTQSWAMKDFTLRQNLFRVINPSLPYNSHRPM